jgi:hypothetical protein
MLTPVLGSMRPHTWWESQASIRKPGLQASEKYLGTSQQQQQLGLGPLLT